MLQKLSRTLSKGQKLSEIKNFKTYFRNKIFNQSRLCPLAVPELFPVLKSMRAKGPLVVTRGKDDNFGFITLSYSLNPSPCTNNIIIA